MTEGDAPSRGESDTAGPGWLTQRRVTLAGTALVLVGLAAAVRAVDAEAVLADVASADARLLTLAVAVYAASWPIRGRRYADVLEAMGRRGGTAFLTAAVFASQTANLALPARAGDAVRAQIVHERRSIPYATGFASLAVERAADLVTVAALAGGSVLALAVLGDTGPLALAGDVERGTTALRIALGVGVVALCGVAGVVALARSDRALGRAIRARVGGHPLVERVVAAALSFLADVGLVARNRQALAVIGSGSLLVWSADVLTAVLVLAAFRTGLDAGSLLIVGTLAVSVGNLAKVLPLSQGGIGLYEGAFTGLLVGLTPVGASVALGAAIVDHALKNVVTLAGGTVSVAALNVSLRDAEPRPAEVPVDGPSAPGDGESAD